MRKLLYARLAIRALTVLGCVVVAIGALTLPVKTEAEVPPPTKPPLPTATDTGEPSDTPAPTDTPRPTDTPMPTDTPAPTDTPMPTDTPAPTDTPRPTDTPMPTDTPIAAAPTWTPTWTPLPTQAPTWTASPTRTPRPTDTSPQPKPEQTSRPDPVCQSLVEGTVTGDVGQGVAGATVSIQGPGWASSMMTDDNGRFGFGGLCAGSATLQGTLPNSQLTAAAAVSLDGKSGVNIELSTQTGGASAPTQAAATATDQDAQPSPMPEPSMPITGYSGLLQVAGTILGALLIVFAGARRLLSVGD
jgi:hypothetical protein